MFKVWGIIRISKIKLFNFSRTEKVKQNQGKKIKPPKIAKAINLKAIPTKIDHFFRFFIETLTLSFPFPRFAVP